MQDRPPIDVRGSAVAAARVARIARFFGIRPDGREMSVLSGVGRRRLLALVAGHPPVRLALADRAHIRRLAALVDAAGAPDDEAAAAARANWLLVPSLDSPFGRLRPIEWLADRELVARHGAELIPPGSAA